MTAVRSASGRLSAAAPRPRSLGRIGRAFQVIPLKVLISFGIVLIILVGALVPQWFTSLDPNIPTFSARLTPPGSAAFPLGTDDLGRDLLSRVLYGARASLVIGFFATMVGLIIGSVLGLLAGYLGGMVEHVVMYLVDVQLALPFLLLAIAIALIFGNSLPVMVMIAGLATWPGYGRLCRGMALSLRQTDYVTAANSLGAGSLHIIVRHLLPGMMAPLLIFVTLNMGRVILIESALSFLGIGIKPPTPSWGGMIDQGRSLLGAAWWVSTVPGAALSLLTLSIGTIGDWLRDVLDPTLSIT